MEALEKINKTLIKQFIRRRWLFLYVIPVVLFLVASLFTLLRVITYDTHFTVMSIVQTQKTNLQIPQKYLVDDEVIKGEFTTSENNLGAVALRMKNMHPEDVNDRYKIFFRIKEKDAKEWYSSNSYTGGQFKELDLFPFGFNLIADSKGKTYVFELYSKGANRENAITVDQNQRIVTHHQLNKSDLKNPIYALQYLEGKFLYAVQNLEGIYTILIYFLPLLAYYYFLHERRKVVMPTILTYILLIHFINRYVQPPVVKGINVLLHYLYKIHLLDEEREIKEVPLISILLFLFIIGEIFVIQGINNLLVFIIIAVWAISIGLHKFRVDTSYLIAIFFLCLCFIFVLLGIDSYAEKAAIWTYLFLVIGAGHSLVTLREAKNTTKKNLKMVQ